jgi:hypothetical protein
MDCRGAHGVLAVEDEFRFAIQGILLGHCGSFGSLFETLL